jgi:hypothetical protein
MTTDTDKATEQAAISDVFADERDSAGTSAPAAETPARDDGRDDQGRFAAKKAEEAAKTEAAATPPVTAQPAPPVSEQDAARIDHRVPLSELLTEREKRKQDARLREEAIAEARQYKQQLQNMERRFQAQQQPAPTPPDPYLDPEGAFRFQQEQISWQNQQTILNTSEMLARSKHGDQVVDQALEAAKQSGAAQHFVNKPDPYRALVEWYSRAKAMQEIGPDPTAYRTKLEAEIRAKVLEEMKGGAPAAQQPRFPGSLADATQTGQSGGHLTPQSAISSVFEPHTRPRFGT